MEADRPDEVGNKVKIVVKALADFVQVTLTNLRPFLVYDHSKKICIWANVPCQQFPPLKYWEALMLWVNAFLDGYVSAKGSKLAMYCEPSVCSQCWKVK